MGFSSRERFLMRLLMLSVIWAVPYMAFMIPGYKSYALAQQKLNSLEEDHKRMEFYLSHYEDLENELHKMQAKGNTKDFFFRDIDDAYMDRDLQAKAAKAGVTISRMSIGETTYMEPADRAGEDATEPERRAGEGGTGLENRWGKNAQPRILETIITMELESPDGEGIMAFAEEIRQEHKSLSVRFVDVVSVYENGDGGQRRDLGMKGMAEVRYYYEETR